MSAKEFDGGVLSDPVTRPSTRNDNLIACDNILSRHTYLYIIVGRSRVVRVAAVLLLLLLLLAITVVRAHDRGGWRLSASR